MEAINLLVGFFFNLFGSGLIMTLVLSSMFLIILLAWKVDLSVALLVLIPLIVGWVMALQYTNFIEIPRWIIIVLFLIGGLFFASLLVSLYSRL